MAGSSEPEHLVSESLKQAVCTHVWDDDSETNPECVLCRISYVNAKKAEMTRRKAKANGKFPAS